MTAIDTETEDILSGLNLPNIFANPFQSTDTSDDGSHDNTTDEDSDDDVPFDLGDPVGTAVCPFTVVIDTREQAPFRFTGIEADKTAAGSKSGDTSRDQSLIVPTVNACLESGDYSIVGHEHDVAIERKSVGDWFSSISAERDRFEREMERLAEIRYAAVVIEGDWNKLLIDADRRSRMSPKVASRTMANWSIRYGVHFWPMLSRRHAELWTFQLLNQFWRNLQREKKEVASC